MRVPPPIVDRVGGDRTHPILVAWCERHGLDPATVELPAARQERPMPLTGTERVVAALLAEGIVPAGKRPAIVRGLGLDATRITQAETEHQKRKAR